jgi:methylaspartate ammonia-lyase
MPEITNLVTSTGLSGFYADDKAAIQSDGRTDGFVYQDDPVTPGFESIRMPGWSTSVMIKLTDGAVGVGDCALAQYPGSGGRFGPISPAEMVNLIEDAVAPRLTGRDLTIFRKPASMVDGLTVDGEPLHPAIRYGVSQALLDAVASQTRALKTQVLAREFDLPVACNPIRLNAQTGDDRYKNVDKMILKGVDMMPHGLFNTVDKIGPEGDELASYAEWVVERIKDLGPADYTPTVRFDVYGTIGEIFDENIDAIAGYIEMLEGIVSPYELVIEMPISLDDRAEQFHQIAALKDELLARGSDVLLMVDEFANDLADIRSWVDRGDIDVIQVKTIDMGSLTNVVEAVRYCEDNGVRAYQGGTCNETDVSARACVHVAMAAKPFAMASKPGMGVDEGVMIVHNEMQRILNYLGSQEGTDVPA